ncbi:MAG: ABC transporter substrate-binding protein [Nitriliruptoraceae bacterium]
MSNLHRPAAVLALVLTLSACAGEADELSEAAEDDAAETRTVTHDQGETEVPAEPERVVTLDSPHLDAALALGVTPVGSTAVFADEGLPSYLDDRTGEVEVVGTIEEPDLEAVAALEPDLILSATVRHEQIYDQLSEIAPTVFTESSGTDWKQGVSLVAEALGRADEGERALAEHEQRATELGEELGASQQQAGIVRFLPGETRIYGPDTFSGSVLADVGYSLPDLDYDQYSMVSISAEQVELLSDADVLFAATFGAEEESTRGEVTELWGQLPAVADGCQFDVADDEWMIGIGLIGAELILDDLAERLGGTDC